MKVYKLLAIGVCLVLAIVATFLGGLQAIVSAPVIGLLFGMILANIKTPECDYKAGTVFAAKKFLMFGIVLAGATLNFKEVVGVGAKALPLIIFNICLSFGIAYLVGSKLGLTTNTKTLVGAGTAICGGTAIATISPIIKAKEKEMGYALTAIFLFDIIAALAFPYIGNALGLTANQFGFLGGTAISDTSSVVAAEQTFNGLVGIDSGLALTVKLTRTTMLIVLAVIFTVISIRNIRKQALSNENSNTEHQSVGKTLLKVFPWFIAIFVIMAVLNTVGVFEYIGNGINDVFNVDNGVKMVSSFFKNAYKFFVTAALVGVGYKINFKDLFKNGLKPILLGGCTWACVAITSFSFIFIFKDYVG